MSEVRNYWVDVTSTYKVTSAVSLTDDQVRDLIEAYEDGDELARSKVSLKDMSVQIDEA
jgi:hypothetical protein